MSRNPGGGGRTCRLRRKLIRWLWSIQPGLPNGHLIYHGTSDVHAQSILAKGLRPRGNKPSEWQGQESHPEMVYLTDSYPHVFGTQTGQQITAAFEIDASQLDPRRFFPDEDFLVQKHLVEPSAEETAHDVAKSRIREFKERWRDSLRELGTCCYNGRIPTVAFLGLTFFDRSQNFQLATFIASHHVGLEEHSDEGKPYFIVNKWMFGHCGIKGDLFSREGLSRLDD